MFGVIHSTETESGCGSYITLNQHLESSANREGHNGFEGVVGPSRAFREVPDRILTVARTDSTVLIEGETGRAGKKAGTAIHASATGAIGPSSR